MEKLESGSIPFENSEAVGLFGSEPYHEALRNQVKATSRVSHDLNNCLFAISGRIEMLRSAITSEDIEKCEQLVASAEEESRRMAEVVRKLQGIAHEYDELLTGDAQEVPNPCSPRKDSVSVSL